MIFMEKVVSVDPLYADMERIHRSADFYETNFYAGRESIEKWIAWNQLEVVQTEHVLLLLRKSKFSRQVYYFTNDLECLEQVLTEMTGLTDRLNIDFLGKEDPHRELFEKAGFRHYITLRRMDRLQMGGEDKPLEYGEYAVPEDAGQICDILEMTMDLSSDQVPEIREVKDYIDRHEAIVVREEGTQQIISLILWTRKGRGMAWNYWALDPKYKGSIHSLCLLAAYLDLNGSVRRTALFVRDGNPARAVYERFGFQYNGVNDYVYCYRKQKE